MRADVYPRLVNEIADGTLAPGTALVETVLADRLGVSRTPVREALNRLEQDGLIERHERGLRVRTRSAEEILEIYEIRVALEVLAATRAADHRTEMDLVRLRGAQEQMRQATAVDPGTRIELNRDFHHALWRSSHNATLVDQLVRLTRQIHRYSSTTLSTADRWHEAISEHDELIAAIEARDGSSAGAIARQHIEKARSLRLQMFVRDARV
ncbi:GntR family transcriptional regulator [Aeromicrobium sp. CF4.19]|uniref:GntR family transcriptional regulator n=1 Tax=Aeromicrobium sp. CF4.19 TaxID=3373082 RepID=UPI003EE5EE06